MLWPFIFSLGQKIIFAHVSFKWSNNAAHNAGVTCVVVGLGKRSKSFIIEDDLKREVDSISPYLVAGPPLIVEKQSAPTRDLAPMATGNLPSDGGHLILSTDERNLLIKKYPGLKSRLIRRLVGSNELLKGKLRYCLWIGDDDLDEALHVPEIA